MGRQTLGFGRPTLLAIGLVALLAVACGGDQDSSATGQSTTAPDVSPTPAIAPTSTVADSVLPDYMAAYWPDTDFSKHSVSYKDIVPGSEPRVGVPAIDEPIFHAVSEAPGYMADDDPVFGVEINGDARAYPLAILISHEVVNDTVGGVPVVVTYCPLCNSAILFHREAGGRLLDFGVSGNLRLSDLLMYDRQTESWWQQITGEAVVGELTGTRLDFIPSSIVSWREFRESYPDGHLLSRDTGYDFAYGESAYTGYDSPESWPKLLNALPNLRLPSMERVVGLTVDGQDVAYPLSYIAKMNVLNDSIKGLEFVIFHAGERLSPFPAGDGTDRRVIGSTGVFESTLDDTKLSFTVKEGLITDNETGSTWNILGKSVQGPLAGSRLTPLVHGNHFWFAWAAFKPDTLIRGEVDNWPPVFDSP